MNLVHLVRDDASETPKAKVNLYFSLAVQPEILCKTAIYVTNLYIFQAKKLPPHKQLQVKN